MLLAGSEPDQTRGSNLGLQCRFGAGLVLDPWGNLMVTVYN
jgi:hypothetical protein